MLTRRDIEEREAQFLAPYAQKSADSRGRKYKEPEHDYRSIYQRDRDRIIYSSAFRRLEYKTQVFVNHEGDHYRTRLTHTLEVAQIAKTIARALRLNDDLAEAIALAHDLGHTPFGHSGEDALRELMKDHGGFDHNSHGLRVVDFLEERYPGFPGLNLSWEVREGIIKHATPFDRPRPFIPFEEKTLPTLEAQVVDIADEIAYDNHDLDDGIASGLIKDDALKGVGLWKQAAQAIKKTYPSAKREILNYQIVRLLINEQVTDLVIETEKNIKKLKVRSPKDARWLPHKIISFGPAMEEARKPLREFLVSNLYHHYRVVRMSNKASRFINELFKVYLDKTEQLPPTTQSHLKKEDTHRVICDYIAGMTDRYALDEYKRLFEPYERV
ncbi:MAG: deoxyguanosinetriphosphate triphosphohydrolase [Candidatus Omnitrophica bacterium]|nr:deoxyguanosinetriphosphate triphosphohydrolase [Candidatus Omnitrophota bacterium]